MATVGKAIEQGGIHLCITEDGGPLAEAENLSLPSKVEPLLWRARNHIP